MYYPTNVKHMARPVLAHRLIATNQSRLHGRLMEQFVDEVLQTVAVPVESLSKSQEWAGFWPQTPSGA